MTDNHPVRGQVWEYIQGSRQYRVLIISNDEYNGLPGAMPWGLVIQRDTPRAPAQLVQLAANDPHAGASVVIPLIVRCDPIGLRRTLGFVTNNTLNSVEHALRDHLNLP